MDRVSFSPRARSVQRPRLLPGHRHVPGTHLTPHCPSSTRSPPCIKWTRRRPNLEEAAEGDVGNIPWGPKALSIWKERSIACPRRKPLNCAPVSVLRAPGFTLALPPVVPVIIDHLERGHPRTGPTCSCRVLATPVSPVRKLHAYRPGARARAAWGRRFQLLWVRRALTCPGKGQHCP